MLVELHFTVTTGVLVYPKIDVYCNDQLTVNNATLDSNCIILEIDTVKYNNHHIKIQSLNILDEYKTNCDFGFQLRHVVVDGIELGTYGVDFKCVNPANDSYIKNFLEPAGRSNEIEIVDSSTMHVTKGYWSNYVNMPGGWLEFEFCTPLYYWILEKNFGRQLESLYWPNGNSN